MKPRVILSIVLLGLGVIIAAVPGNKTLQFRMSAEELLVDLQGRSQYISPDEIAGMLVNKDPSLQLVDLRSPEDYQRFHLPGAINIPMVSLLEPENRRYIDQGIKLNVFYSNSSVTANEAWIICKQLGYPNNYVLEGGLNYWAETILNPEKPADYMSNEEIARYDFRMGASRALGGAAGDEGAPAQVSSPMPAVKRSATKKRAQGGC